MQAAQPLNLVGAVLIGVGAILQPLQAQLVQRLRGSNAKLEGVKEYICCNFVFARDWSFCRDYSHHDMVRLEENVPML